MSTVTVSPTYQIVIPKEIRQSMAIRPGHKIQMLTCGNRIELIPIKPMCEIKGFLKGIDTEALRESDRA